MAELTHDAEDGFHEIQLSGKQLVFLFMLTTTVSVAIFLCGVLVGRGVRAERGEEVVAAAPASQTTAGPAAGEAPTPAAEPSLSYDERLRRDSAAAETLKKSSEPAVKPPAAQPEPVAPEPPPAAAASKPAATEAVRSVPAPKGESSTGPQPGNWVIQVHALQNRDAANTLVRSLKSKGYPAFVLAPATGSPQIFRVQIGGYRDRSDAEKVASRLKDEQFKPDIKRR